MGTRKRLRKEAVINNTQPKFILRDHQHIYSLTWGHCFICRAVATDQPMSPILQNNNLKFNNKFFPKG